MGIEPTSEAWEALNKTLKAIDLAALSFLSEGLKLETRWKLKQLQIVAMRYAQLHQRLRKGTAGKCVSGAGNDAIKEVRISLHCHQCLPSSVRTAFKIGLG
jgi:hypothetical protein